MKAYGLSAFLVLSMAGFGQESTQTKAMRFDVNGNPIPAGTFSESKTQADGRTVRTEYAVSVNGERVPLSSSEEVKIEKDGRTVTQTIIRQFDQNGVQTSTERIQSEERKLGENSSEKETTVYRTDVNGNESIDARTTSRTEGKTTITNFEKRGLDGGLTLAERETSTTEKTANGSTTQSAKYQRDTNGNMLEIVREARETVKKGDQTVENESKYVARGDGSFALQEQVVTRSTKRADGTVAKEIEVYGEQVPGVTNESGRPALKEIQVVQSRKASDGSLVETTTSQKAEVTGNGRLTAPQVIQETVTTGKQ